jgi:hypothetical protein
VALGQPDQARTLLAEARRIYDATDMPVGAAIARLTTAQLDLQDGDYAAAATRWPRSSRSLPMHAAGWLLQTRWLLGVLARLEGRLEEAQAR